MKRSIRSLAVLMALCLTVMSTATLFVYADEELSSNYLEAYGDFEGMIPNGETEYLYNNDHFGGTAGGTLSGGVNTLKKDGDNTYLEIKGDHNDAFGDIWMRFNLGEGNVKLAEAGTYTVSFRFYKVPGWKPTENTGMRIYQGSVVSDIQLQDKINAAPEGVWNTMTFETEVQAAGVSAADSIHFWLMKTPGSTLYLDDFEVRYHVPAANAPEVSNLIGTYNENTNGDNGLVFKTDFKGMDLVSITSGDTELESTDYVYDAEAGELTFPAAFCKKLGEGEYTLTIKTEGGSVDVLVKVVLKGVEIPDSTDGYVLVDIMNLDGTFESYEEVQLEDWTANEVPWSYKGVDDCGWIISDDNGNKLLKLDCVDYPFADIMMSYDVSKMQVGSIVTIRFDAKYTGTAALAEVTFVGASNIRYHRVELHEHSNITAEDNPDQIPYEIKWTDKGDGWYTAEVTFAASFAMMNSCDRVRILMDAASDGEIYLDNIEMLLWMDENSANPEPTVNPDAATFDGSAPADLVFTTNLKDYPITTIVCGAVGIKPAYYTLTENDTVLTISKDYLATLENGTHELRLITLGGEVTFKITVTNNTAQGGEGPVEAPSDGGIWLYVGTAAAVVVVAAVVIVPVKKRSGKKG